MVKNRKVLMLLLMIVLCGFSFGDMIDDVSIQLNTPTNTVIETYQNQPYTPRIKNHNNIIIILIFMYVLQRLRPIRTR